MSISEAKELWTSMKAKLEEIRQLTQMTGSGVWSDLSDRDGMKTLTSMIIDAVGPLSGDADTLYNLLSQAKDESDGDSGMVEAAYEAANRVRAAADDSLENLGKLLNAIDMIQPTDEGHIPSDDLGAVNTLADSVHETMGYAVTLNDGELSALS